MSDTITDRKTAVALVKYERDRSKVVYADYIAANAVTLESVSEHVKALQSLAFPKYDAKVKELNDIIATSGGAPEATEQLAAIKYERKTFGNRVRNGLNHTLGKHLVAREEPETPETSEADAEEGSESVVETVRTPVGAFADAIRTFADAGYSAEEAFAVVADVLDVAPLTVAA